MVSEGTLFLKPLSEALDLLNVVDLKQCFVCGLSLEKEGEEDGPLGVGVYTTSCTTFCEGGDEEGGALGGFEGWWGAEIYSFLWVGLLGESKDVDIFC